MLFPQASIWLALPHRARTANSIAAGQADELTACVLTAEHLRAMKRLAFLTSSAIPDAS
jgi:hypothetical protein